MHAGRTDSWTLNTKAFVSEVFRIYCLRDCMLLMPGRKRAPEDNNNNKKKKKSKTNRRSSEIENGGEEREVSGTARVARGRRENRSEESKVDGGPVPEQALLETNRSRRLSHIERAQERWQRAIERSRQAEFDFNGPVNRFGSVERSERIRVNYPSELQQIADEFDLMSPRFSDCAAAIQNFRTNFGGKDNWLKRYLDLYNQEFASLFGSVEEWVESNTRIERIQTLIEF